MWIVLLDRIVEEDGRLRPVDLRPGGTPAVQSHPLGCVVHLLYSELLDFVLASSVLDPSWYY